MALACRNSLVAYVAEYIVIMETLSESMCALQWQLGYIFTRPELLEEALTHRSCVRQKGKSKRRRKTICSNERLEFMGDRVLGVLMVEWLLICYPNEQEGELAHRLAHLVSRPVLARIAEQLGLQNVLVVAMHGMQMTAKIMADTLEAVLGAVFLDGGLHPARIVVRRFWKEALKAQLSPPKDPKTALQEWLLARTKSLPVYEVTDIRGADHAPLFVVRVTACGEFAEGCEGSKRKAESMAASLLLNKLQSNGKSSILNGS